MTDALVLVPTELERARLVPHLGDQLELVGFGPIAAAARTAELLARHRPRRVLLIGIAGSYDLARAPLGAALAFGRVRCDGVGVARAAGFLGPRELRLPQRPALDGRDAVYDELALDLPDTTGADATLLTAPTASADDAEARARRVRHPDALAEDMEGFGVALACVAGATPLCVVRGISNAVGDRDHAGWRIEEALDAAAALARRALDAPWSTAQDGAR